MIEWNTFAVFVYKQYHFQLILNLSGSIKDYKMKDRLKIDMDHIVWVLKKSKIKRYGKYEFRVQTNCKLITET